jgi:hypothetical protein
MITDTASTTTQIVAPVNAMFSGLLFGFGGTAGAGIATGLSGGRAVVVVVGGVSVLTAASASTTPLPTTGSQPPGG